MKSNLSKILGGVSDYFFGLGSGTYTEMINFYENNYEGYEKKVQIISEKIHDKIKIITRLGLTCAEVAILYNSIIKGDNSRLGLIPLAEAVKFWSFSNENKRTNNMKERKNNY